MSDIAGQRFANVGRDRQTIVPLALATHQEFSRPPVNIIELDGDHLGRTKSEAGQQQHHCIIAPPMLRLARTAASTAST